MCYKQTKKSVAAIAQELNADAIVEGSVLRSGQNLRINCRLIDPRSEDLLWCESFNHHLRDILVVHDDLTKAIASGLRTHIQQRSVTYETPRSINPESYDAYLRGRYFWNKRNEPNLRKAIECFQHALDGDPLYAPAWTGIADSYFYLGYSFGRMEPSEAMPKAKAAALRALELDPHSGDAHASLGVIQGMYDWDWIAAEASLKRSFELISTCTHGHHFYSLLLSAHRRTDESLAHIHAALQMDPLSLPVNNFVGMMRFAARQFDPAITALRKTIEMDPNFGLAHSGLGACLEAKGLHDEATEEYVTSLRVGNRPREEYEAIRAAYEKAGMAGLHQQDLTYVLQRWNGWHASMVDIAGFHTGLGHPAEALDWLERACDVRSGRLVWLNSGMPGSRMAQYFDSLRSEPRFIRILERVQLPS
jgi:tetratricopeptide (TPR) repeat protein